MSAVIDARDITRTHELAMSTPEMDWLAKGMLVAAARAEADGVLYHAHLVAEGMTAVVEATDRFRIHQMHITLHDDVAEIDVVVPRTALAWAAKNARIFKPKNDALYDPVAILQITQHVLPDEKGRKAGWVSVIFREWEDESAPSARFDAPLVPDTYPPLERTIRSARNLPGGPSVPIPLLFLADAGKLQTPTTPTPAIEYHRRADGAPGPAILDFWEGGTLRSTAVIQPVGSRDDEDEETD